MAKTQEAIVQIAGEEVELLATRFKGALLGPGDEGYDDSRRIWNGDIDRFPALIARCTGVADVITAVQFARGRDIPVSLRGGGHGVAGHAVADSGLLIDLQPMRGMRVDPERHEVVAQAGLTWGSLDHETQAFGLATTGGLVTSTGIAGLTLGGGIGWLMRKYGLTVDNVVSVDLVGADGQFLTASDDENPDLFWGLKGGGGNFGIATSFTYRLHPIGQTVLAGPLLYPLEKAHEVLRFYRDFIADSPKELTTALNLRRAPAVPFIPEHLHGAPVVGIVACWAGDIEKGETALKALREFGEPIVDLIAPKPYVAHQSMFDATVPAGWHYYWKSWLLPPLSDALIDVLVEHVSRISSPLSACPVYQLGGAVGEIDEDAAAYSHRDAAHNINIASAWTSDDPEPERHIEWTREFFDALSAFAHHGVYSNFLGEEGEERVRQAYEAEKYERLVALKREYDPDNFFRMNQNISPD